MASSIGKPLEPYFDENGEGGDDIVLSPVSFRYGHTAVAGHYSRIQNNGLSVLDGPVLVRDALFRPHTYKVHNTDSDPTAVDSDASILRGLSNQLAGNVDIKFCDDMRNFVLSTPTKGSDLLSINIARGRDHGVPDYNSAREAFGLPIAEEWSDISSVVLIQELLEEQ
eukprot:TRINITY_DN3044_c0_g7_i1.p1 TRINITY_DN3044_c0_g7~~TRINITY_DN3044_c0_g7_i1.p1  ORF type:complete len:168 (+),score=48.45 TRINITY_DN3044_c0_g7_i1:595-1098(+)